MANPNLLNISSVYGVTSSLTPSVNTAVVLLNNAASSGHVFKIESIVATNIDGTNAINASLYLYDNGAVVKGSAPSGGTTSSYIASTISIPANASLVLLDKTTTIYLTEGNSLVVQSGTASKIVYTVSYEDMA